MADGRQHSWNIQRDSNSPYASRVIFCETLESLRKTTHEMTIKTQELVDLFAQIENTKAEIRGLEIAINVMSAKFGLEPVLVRHKS